MAHLLNCPASGSAVTPYLFASSVYCDSLVAVTKPGDSLLHFLVSHEIFTAALVSLSIDISDLLLFTAVQLLLLVFFRTHFSSITQLFQNTGHVMP